MCTVIRGLALGPLATSGATVATWIQTLTTKTCKSIRALFIGETVRYTVGKKERKRGVDAPFVPEYVAPRVRAKRNVSNAFQMPQKGRVKEETGTNNG